MEGLRLRRGKDHAGDSQSETDVASDDPNLASSTSRPFIRPSVALAAGVFLTLTVAWRWRRGTHPTTSPDLYTPEQLSQFTGKGGRGRVLIAVMGSVFDVSSGRQHYGPDGGYHFFAGRDGTRSFVTGDFKNDLHDNIADFTPEQHADALRWREFYTSHAEYTFAGRVVGRFFDADGDPTPLLILSETKAEIHREQNEEKEREKRGAAGSLEKPSLGGVVCDSSWSVAKGGWVHCEEGTYPRRVLVERGGASLSANDGVKERCVCFEKYENMPGQRLYEGCDAQQSRCQTSPPQSKKEM